MMNKMNKVYVITMSYWNDNKIWYKILIIHKKEKKNQNIFYNYIQCVITCLII